MSKFVICSVERYNADFYKGCLLTILKKDLPKFFTNNCIPLSVIDRNQLVVYMWKSTDSFLSDVSCAVIVARIVEDFVPIINCVTQSQNIQSSSTNAINIYCACQLCEQFCVGSGDNVLVRICTSTLRYIDRVIVAANNKDAFVWASTREFSDPLINTQSTAHLFLSKNDSLTNMTFENSTCIWQQFSVLNCSPVLHGYIRDDADIIIKDMCESVICHHPSRQDTDASFCPKPLLLSDFTGELLERKAVYNHNIAENYLGTIRCVAVNIVCDLNKMHLILDPHNTTYCKTDEYSTVVFTKRDASILKIFDGNLLEIIPHGNRFSRQTVVQLTPKEGGAGVEKRQSGKVVVAAVSDVFKNHGSEVTVYMLPCVWFNICNVRELALLEYANKGCSLQSIICERPDKYSVSSCMFIHDLPYASEIIVTSINNPSYSSASSIDSLLQNYFSTTRLLQQGDVFSISAKMDLLESGECENFVYPVAYFKVEKLAVLKSSCAACLVSSSHTALILESAVSGFIPAEMHAVYNPSLRTLSAFDQYVHAIIDLLKPFLSKREVCGDFFPLILIEGSRGSGKTSISRALAHQLCMHHYTVNCNDLVADTSAAVEAKIEQCIVTVTSSGPCIWLLQDIDILSKSKQGNNDKRILATFRKAIMKITYDHGWPVIVIATTSSHHDISTELHDCFIYHFSLASPDEEMRTSILKELLSDDLAPDLTLRHIAQRCAGLVLADLSMLANYAKQTAYNNLVAVLHAESKFYDYGEELELREACAQIQTANFESALSLIQSSQSDTIGAPKVPNITWNDVGGLANVKKDILDTIQLPLLYPQLLSSGLRRSGVLLYGPPGTGKTLLAKAVATECSLNFLSVKGPELLNMYVGQSEENVREVFNRARNATPCVIFFDELDSLAPNRGRSGDSGGVMDRVVSQLLAEIDGLQKSADVFIIGATNRPDLLDPALLRPGRFDKLVYLGVSEDKESQLKIVKALTRKFHLAADCRLENIVEKCSLNMTGADFYALCSDAMLSAMSRAITNISAGLPVDIKTVLIEERDFYTALANLVPSLSTSELQHYVSLKAHFECVEAAT